MMSSSTTRGWCSRTSSSAVRPSLADSVWYPSASRLNCSIHTTCGSSSTTRMLVEVFVIIREAVSGRMGGRSIGPPGGLAVPGRSPPGGPGRPASGVQRDSHSSPGAPPSVRSGADGAHVEGPTAGAVGPLDHRVDVLGRNDQDHADAEVEGGPQVLLRDAVLGGE